MADYGSRPASSRRPASHNHAGFGEIEAIAKENGQTIQSLNAQARATIYVTTYVTQHQSGKFSVHENKVTQSGQHVLNSWRDNIELYEIPDIFNMDILYSCSSYRDIQRLNTVMLELARRFDFFGDSHKTLEAMVTLKHNFEQIRIALAEITLLLSTGGSGHLTSIQEQLDNVNNQLHVLRKKHKNIQFQ
jgi:hypothetical protein